MFGNFETDEFEARKVYTLDLSEPYRVNHVGKTSEVSHTKNPERENNKL